MHVEISVGYVGVIPSSYPINAIYQWTGGPGRGALLRVALHEDAGVAVEALKERLRDRLLATEDAGRAVLVRAGGHCQRRDELRLANPGRGRRERPELGGQIGPMPRRSGPSWPRCPTLRDLQYVQALDYPTVSVEVDRERAGISGVTVEEVARSLVTATSSSRFVVPNYWPDPKSGIGYQVQVEIPVAVMDSIKQVETIPVQRPGGPPCSLRDVAKVRRGTMPGEYDRYNMKREPEPDREHRRARTWVGSRAVVSKAIERGRTHLPREWSVDVRGQVAPMREMLNGSPSGS